MRLTPLEPWIAARIGAAGFGVGSARLDRAALEAWQVARLNDVLARVRGRSRFGRRAFSGGPAVLSSPGEIAKLAFTTADDLRADPSAFVCVPQDEVARIVTLDTSGTSGPPKRLFFTHADQSLTVDFFAAGMSVFTAPGDRVLILLPCTTPGSVGDLLADAMGNLGAEVVRHGPVRDGAEALRVARASGATVAVGIPVHLLRMVRAGGDGVPALHSILLSTDHVPSAIVAAIEAAWGSRVYNHFGMTETGLGGGVDCEARRGLHLREADLLFEVVDPAGEAVLPEGEEGELVVTTLTREAMPLVRYRTGDLARWVPGPCPCGTSLRTLAHLTTRVAGRYVLPGGSILTQAELDEAVFPIDGVLDFLARWKPAAEALELAVEVVPGESLPAVAEAVRAAVAGGIPGVTVTVVAQTERLPPGRSSKRMIAVSG